MDKLTKEQRSWNMSRVRSSGTAFEIRIFRELRNRGLNFQKNYGGIIGKPDIAKPKYKKAILLHSDFWHGWRFPHWIGVLPNNFWKQKIWKNRKRDRQVVRELRRKGWYVMVVWEHSFVRDYEACIEKIVKFLR